MSHMTQHAEPSVVTWELVAVTITARDVCAGDVIIIEPTGGVIEVLGATVHGRTARIRGRVRARSRREVVWQLPVDTPVYREHPASPW